MVNTMAPGSCVKAPESLFIFWEAEFAADPEMPTLALRKCCTEHPASAFAGDFRITLCFAGEDGH